MPAPIDWVISVIEMNLSSASIATWPINWIRRLAARRARLLMLFAVTPNPLPQPPQKG